MGSVSAKSSSAMRSPISSIAPAARAPEKPARLRIGDLYLIENNYQLYSLLRSGRAVINYSQQ